MARNASPTSSPTDELVSQCMQRHRNAQTARLQRLEREIEARLERAKRQMGQRASESEAKVGAALERMRKTTASPTEGKGLDSAKASNDGAEARRERHETIRRALSEMEQRLSSVLLETHDLGSLAELQQFAVRGKGAPQRLAKWRGKVLRAHKRLRRRQEETDKLSVLKAREVASLARAMLEAGAAGT